MHFFSSKGNYAMGDDWYESMFNKAHDIVCYVGDFTPNYILFSWMPELIAKTCGVDAKIIISLRHPVDRAYSQFNHYRLLLAEKRKDFATAMAEDADERLDDAFEDLLSPRLYIQRSLYHDTTQRYQSVFGPQSVKVIMFEDLVKDQQGVLDDICDFLGVSRLSIEHDVHENWSRPPKTLVAQGLLRAGKLAKTAIKPIMPLGKYQSIRNRFISDMTAKPDKLDPATRSALFERFFKDDCERLSKLLGRTVYV